MKLFLSTILLLLCFENNAQIPPGIQWQKCLGGTTIDWARDIESTPDGGSIMCGFTLSNNGNVSGNHGSSDAWVVKIDVSGNIQWQKCFGGTSPEDANEIIQTSDGGYIFAGSTNSNNGDVSGNHSDTTDIWVVKLDAIGNLQWQKCYGGIKDDQSNSIYQTSDGGYIIGGMTRSGDGDVTGYHTSPFNIVPAPDAWILKIDASGNLQWQKCFGGTHAELETKIIQSTDGGYFFAVTTWSSDGDVVCGNNSYGRVWMVKLDNTGSIQWKFCWGGVDGQEIHAVQQDTDGGFIIAGETYSSVDRQNLGFSDAFVIKTDATGTIQWQRLYGGSDFDRAQSIILTADGGYVLTGYTYSSDVDVCRNNGGSDFWVIKLNDSGAKEWQKTYGGSNSDFPVGIGTTADGGYIAGGYTSSNDGDITGNHGISDWWVVKLAFPGIPVLPSVNIAAGNTIICPGQNVTFIATPTDGGTAPSYQWKINGVNAATDDDTVIINTFNNGDIVSCILTSNSPCVTSPTDTSNIISITVDPTLAPVNFLPADTVICEYGTVDLKAAGNYKTYLWSNNATTPFLTISQPDTYWLQVTTNSDCPGSDTIVVILKDCLKGFYMPTAFTPNGDGKNDVLRPILGGNIKQYKFAIANRWGQIVFQTSETGKGWDGTFKGKKQDGNVFIWICTYQFEGEDVKSAKGTVVIIK